MKVGSWQQYFTLSPVYGPLIITSVHDDLSPLTRTSHTLAWIGRNADLQRACPTERAYDFYGCLIRECACTRWMSEDSPNWMRHRLIHKVRHRLINGRRERWDNGACRAIAYRFDWIVLLSTDRRHEKSFGQHERLMTYERRGCVSVYDYNCVDEMMSKVFNRNNL